jgi:glycosyltransferase involved in cell wall biosynthesis
MANDSVHVLVEVLSSDLRMGATNDALDLVSLTRDMNLRFTFCGRLDDRLRAEARSRGAATIGGHSRMLSKAGVAPYGASVAAWMARLGAVRPDVVHLDYAGWAPSLACAAHLLRVPVVGRAGGAYNPHNKANDWIANYVANCDAHAATLKNSPLAGRVVVTGSLFRVDRLAPPYRAARPIPPRRPGLVRFLFLGQLVERKGIDVLVSAFAHMRVQAELLLVGGDWRAEGFPQRLREMVACRGLGDRVHFENHRDDAPALLDDCDVFVLPSRSEARPRTIIEAMYLGKPVVATSVGGVPTLVQDGRTGLLVPSDDDDQLAAALDRMAGGELLRHRLGEAAQAWARAEVQPEQAARAHAQMYRRLARAVRP